MCNQHKLNNKCLVFHYMPPFQYQYKWHLWTSTAKIWNTFICQIALEDSAQDCIAITYKYRLLKGTQETRYKMRIQNTKILLASLYNFLSLGLRENLQGVFILSLRLFLCYIKECRNSICLRFSSCNASEELLHSPPYGSDDSLRNVAESSTLHSS